VRWVGGADGAFDDPANWDPAVVPGTQGGECDVALYAGGGDVEVDLSALTALSARGLVPRAPGDRTVDRIEVRDGALVSVRGGTLRVVPEGNVSPVGLLVADAALFVGSDSPGSRRARWFVPTDTVVVGESVLRVQSGGDLLGGGALKVGGGSVDGARFEVERGGAAISGPVTIASGARSRATVAGEWQTADLAVGSETGIASTLEVKDGGELTTTGESQIGPFAGALGKVDVAGLAPAPDATPARWVTTDTVFVGPAGTLDVREGGLVETPALDIEDGSVSVVGGELQVASGVTVDGSPGGRLMLREQGAASMQQLEIPGFLDENGTVEVDGATLECGELEVGNGGIGTLDLRFGAEARTSGDAVVGPAAGNLGDVRIRGVVDSQVGDPPSWQVGGNVTIGADADPLTGLVLLGTGTLRADGPLGVRVLRSGKIAGSGDIVGRVESAGVLDGFLRIEGNLDLLPGNQCWGTCR
jgi:hypothetical protein